MTPLLKSEKRIALTRLPPYLCKTDAVMPQTRGHYNPSEQATDWFLHRYFETTTLFFSSFKQTQTANFQTTLCYWIRALALVFFLGTKWAHTSGELRRSRLLIIRAVNLSHFLLLQMFIHFTLRVGWTDSVQAVSHPPLVCKRMKKSMQEMQAKGALLISARKNYSTPPVKPHRLLVYPTDVFAGLLPCGLLLVIWPGQHPSTHACFCSTARRNISDWPGNWMWNCRCLSEIIISMQTYDGRQWKKGWRNVCSHASFPRPL